MSPALTEKTYVAIVDNDESFNRSLSRLLRASGYEAVSYGSAGDFFNDRNRPRFDCLVLDVHLGGMTGAEVHRQLATLGSTTPVIYLSAEEDPAARQQALDGGSAGYFSKVDPGSALLDAIRRSVAPKTNG